MLSLILAFALMWAVLLAVLWAGALFVQGYLYSETEPQLYWRAPAAVAAMTLVTALWAALAYKSPSRYQPWFFQTGTTDTQVKQLEAMIGTGAKHTDPDNPKNWRRYRPRKDSRGVIEYWVDDSGRRLPMPVDAIRVKENDQVVLFNPDRDPKTGTFWRAKGQPLFYRDDRGRTMSDTNLGVISTSRAGVLMLSWVLSLLILAVWFAALWLLLRFQWPHALGLAVVLWLVFTLLLQPALIRRLEDARNQRRQALRTNGAPYKMCMMSPSWTT